VNNEKFEYANARDQLYHRATRFFRDGLDEEQTYLVTMTSLEPKFLTLTEVQLFGSKVALEGISKVSSCVANSYGDIFLLTIMFIEVRAAHSLLPL